MKLSVLFSIVFMGLVVVSQADRGQHRDQYWSINWNQYANQDQSGSQQNFQQGNQQGSTLGNQQVAQQGNPQTSSQSNRPTTQQQPAQQVNQQPAQQVNQQTTSQVNQQTRPQSNRPTTQEGNTQPSQQVNQQPSQQVNQQTTSQVNQQTRPQSNRPTTQEGNTQPSQQANQPPTQQANQQTRPQSNRPTTQEGNTQPSQQVNQQPSQQVNQQTSPQPNRPTTQLGNTQPSQQVNQQTAELVSQIIDHDRDHDRIPIPIISDKAASAIVQALSMLTDSLKAAAAEEVYDRTGVLSIIRELLTDAIKAMNTLFTEVSGAVSDRITRNRGPDDPLSELMEKVEESVRAIKRVLRTLEGKIKPSEISDIENAIEDIAQKVANLKIFWPKRDRAPASPFLSDDADRYEEGEPINTYYHYGLDLQTVIDDWATAIEGIANAIKTLAKAIQKVITTRTLAITVQKSVHKSLAISGSYLSSVSKQLNTDLENLKTKLGQFAQRTVSQLNQAYSSITSNPTKWHHRLLSKLFDFLAAYSDYVHRVYLRKITSSINEAEQDIVSEIIKQTRKSGLEIAQAATHITDRAAASFNHRVASECALKQLPNLMGPTNSLNRLAQCISVENSNINGLSTRGQQFLTQAKDNGVSIANQLMVCNSGTDECYYRFSDVFDHKKSRAKDDLKNAGEQVADALHVISKRIENCLETIAEEIKATTKKCKRDFDFCARF